VVDHIVTEADTAHSLGNPNVHVLGTPMLLRFIEKTIGQLWRGHRDPNEEILLGTEFHLKHLGPARIGETVTVRATLTGVDRRRNRYVWEARVGERLICQGHSENVLMPLSRFRQRLP
jgi:fluoroacetyl-CoA thioesterase